MFRIQLSLLKGEGVVRSVGEKMLEEAKAIEVEAGTLAESQKAQKIKYIESQYQQAKIEKLQRVDHEMKESTISGILLDRLKKEFDDS